MKNERVDLRLEPALKRTFESVARFRHMSLSGFFVQAGLRDVERARRSGLNIKEAMKPRDERRGVS